MQQRCLHGVTYWGEPNEFAPWCQQCQRLEREMNHELNPPTPAQRCVAAIKADPSNGKFAFGFSPKNHRG